MSGFEVNKIIASVIIAIIIFAVIGFIGNLLVNLDDNDEQKTAYKIDLSEISTESINQTASNSVIVEPISPILVNASLEKGEKIFKKCGSCHNYEKGSANKVGPNLWNIINRSKASAGGFAYSKALVELGGEWTYDEIAEFLYKPKEYVKGTKMNFAGLKNVEDMLFKANEIELLIKKNSSSAVNIMSDFIIGTSKQSSS